MFLFSKYETQISHQYKISGKANKNKIADYGLLETWCHTAWYIGSSEITVPLYSTAQCRIPEKWTLTFNSMCMAALNKFSISTLCRKFQGVKINSATCPFCTVLVISKWFNLFSRNLPQLCSLPLCLLLFILSQWNLLMLHHSLFSCLHILVSETIFSGHYPNT